MHTRTLICSIALLAATAPFASVTAQSSTAKRPMTFEDMMKMKRLGETAVSPDGKWLAYGVTSVNLEQNTRTTELWLQAIAGGEPRKLAVALPGDSGLEFAPDSKRILFFSSRSGSQQLWLADFDSATGAASDARRLTGISTEADNAKWSPDGKAIAFTSAVYPECPAITPTNVAGDKCNADVPSKMLYFPDEGHWVLKPQNSQLWYKTVNDWVDQWIGGTASRH